MTWRDPRSGLAVYRPLQRKTPLNKRSARLTIQMRLYRKEAAAFLAEPEHATCEFPLGCNEPSTSVQHRRGRFGGRLRDQRYWAGSCAFHQDFAETRTGEALACGWLLRIESVR